VSHPDGLPDLFLDRSLGRIQARRHGWAVLMKDARIRRRSAEQRALIDHRVRAFCLAAGSLRSAEMSERFVTNLGAMAAACSDPGPFIYAVHATRIVRLPVE
jgi:hypothetical protein